MTRACSIKEYWTATRQGLVVVGKPKSIRQLAIELQLPPDAPVVVSTTHATLAIWGDALDLYTRAFAQSSEGVATAS